MSIAMATETLSNDKQRLCGEHGGDAAAKPIYCNNLEYVHLPECAQVKLNLPKLMVYTVPLESHQFYVVLKEGENTQPHRYPQHTFGPFCIKQDKNIEEIYSCCISADRKHVMLSVSLSSIANHTIPIKSQHDFCMAIFDTYSKIGVQRTMLEPGTFFVGTFHISKQDTFFVVSYDNCEHPIIRSRCLNSRSPTMEKSLAYILDPDCENLLTISSSHDFLVLQVIEADLSPPYCTSHLYLLSYDTLAIVKKITSPVVVAPCHISCTMNYLPDHSIQEGYIKLTFPKVLKTTLISDPKKTTGARCSEALSPVKLPTVRVHSLRRLARNTIRYHVNCDVCASELQLPEILQSYLL